MMDPLRELGPLGQLIIREASYRIVSVDPPHHSESDERQVWAKAPLRWCYETAATVLRAFPASRLRK